MPEVTLFTLQYPWDVAATMLHAWQGWVAEAPDELWSNCQLLSQGTYGYLAQVAGVYCGSPAELASVMSPLTPRHCYRADLHLQRIERLPQSDGDRSGVLRADHRRLSRGPGKSARLTQSNGLLGEVQLRRRSHDSFRDNVHGRRGRTT